MFKNTFLVLVIIFVGILGVVSIYEDIALLTGRETWGAEKIAIKYLIALLGSISYAVSHYINKNR